MIAAYQKPFSRYVILKFPYLATITIAVVNLYIIIIRHIKAHVRGRWPAHQATSIIHTLYLICAATYCFTGVGLDVG